MDDAELTELLKEFVAAAISIAENVEVIAVAIQAAAGGDDV